MFAVLQQHQYAYPIKSTIRELVSNGIDSIAEKQMASNILTGKAAVKDYYEELEGDIYEGSKFDPSYYNLQYFSNDNEVHIIYHEAGATGKDFIIIQDFGVGLGGQRLKNYFNLGWSSKRLLKSQLGKFGLGNKSPLSIGIPYYTIESAWNGELFRFNVYSTSIESLIPAYDFNTSKTNIKHSFVEDDGREYVFYSEETTLPNGVSVIIPAKKHHKEQYIDAVKQQLLYFDNVRLFTYNEESQQKIEIPVKAEIMYEDNRIVLSKNDIYSKPHLLLNKVNYGFINFQELELEERKGNIGIKVDPTEVSINPSRETLNHIGVYKQSKIGKF